jgi:hypothetical protein
MTNTPQVLDDHRLVHKVNQIALFFEPYPREAAIEGLNSWTNSSSRF